MAVNTKTIKRRIKSIGNTKKITKAMEMISAVKMRKAIANVLATRNYARMAWGMLQDIGKITDVSLHPLLQKRPVKKIGLIMITSNRGLAGGFSSKLLIELDEFIKKEKVSGATSEVILLGKRGRKIYKNFGHTVSAEFDKVDLTAKIEEVLPFVGENDDKNLTKNEEENNLEFTFEPNPLEVLDLLIPRLVEMQIYQAILESDASEHSARMMSMRNASDAAGDIIKELNY